MKGMSTNDIIICCWSKTICIFLLAVTRELLPESPANFLWCQPAVNSYFLFYKKKKKKKKKKKILSEILCSLQKYEEFIEEMQKTVLSYIIQ